MNRLTVAELVTAIAARSALKEQQVRAVLRAQAAVVYEHVAKDKQVPLPGLGVVEREEKPGFDRVVPDGPDRGRIIHQGGMKKLRIAISWVAAGVILNGQTPPADVLKLNPFVRFRPKARGN